LSEILARNAGIKNASVNAGEIKQTITLYGTSVLEPNALSHIRARFPGMITQLKASIGDTVIAGEIVAEIESNDSLQPYSITSPISGVVTTRNANPGEMANEQVLLTVTNLDQLWVELRLFPSQTQNVFVGQAVTIFSENRQAQSVIKHLLPIDSDQPFIVARAPLVNAQKLWSPGLLLSASVIINQVQVSLAVDNNAIHVIEGKTVVFVKNKGGYQAHPLVLGRSDSQFTEVVSGLQLGEQYAVENSYLLKADLGKSSASHDH